VSDIINLDRHLFGVTEPVMQEATMTT